MILRWKFGGTECLVLQYQIVLKKNQVKNILIPASAYLYSFKIYLWISEENVFEESMDSLQNLEDLWEVKENKDASSIASDTEEAETSLSSVEDYDHQSTMQIRWITNYLILH